MKKRLITILIGLCTLPLFISAQEFVRIDDPENLVNQIVIRGFYRGCAWVDVDNDGDLDLTLLGHALENDGNGNFTKIESFGTAAEGSDVPDFLGGISWADYDNDGDLDCLYSTASFIGGATIARTFIYDNDGAGNFSEKLIDEDPERTLKTWSASFGEFNNDGYIDVTGAVAFSFLSGVLDTPGYLYTGSETGNFTEVTDVEFAQETAPYTVAYWTDYDEDGDSDLFIAAGPGGAPGPDFHYKNMLSENGTAELVRITDEPFAIDMQDGQTYNMIDYELDGDLDMILTNYNGALNRVYQNNGGEFSSIQNNLTFSGPTLGNCWGDFDNDGDQDVIITSDNINTAKFYRNDDGTFTEAGAPFDEVFPAGTSNVSGLTIGDYDNDGDLDFFAQGGIANMDGPRGLYRNDLDNENHWINITCEGDPSNKAAIGARLQLKATINGQERWLKREVSAQNTFMGHNSLRVHFGLGDAEIVDSLIISWPSGTIDGFIDMAVDSFYQIVEGSSITNSAGEVFSVTKAELEISPNPGTPGETQITHSFPQNTNSINFIIRDTSGKSILKGKASGVGQRIVLDTSSLVDGFYFVTLTNAGEEQSGKLVIQR